MPRQMTEAEFEFSVVAPNYYRALMALGATNRERARRLNVSVRQFIEYKQGKAFPGVRRLKLVPELDDALTIDLPAISLDEPEPELLAA